MSQDKLIKCAFVYDFDGTLAEGDCAQWGVMPELGIEPSDFWDEVKKRCKEDDGDEVLAYLGLLAEKARELGANVLSIEELKKHGSTIPLFPGVESWFERINEYGNKHGLCIFHYIISSGLEAMIRGTKIESEFRQIYACKYHYSEDGSEPVWAAQAVNYTTKTQFLFRINKGIDNAWDNEAINRFVEMPDREVPFDRMVFFGDGDTDIPSMKMVRLQGGTSIAVFDTKKWKENRTQEKVEKLIAEERASYVVPATYEEGGQLDVTAKGLLQLFKRRKI